jgi:F-type H+-transporting ATPase subunit epsilon
MPDISVDLVSQEKKVWAGSARSISAPSVNGQIGIWAGHTPLMAVLQPGHVSLIATDGSQFDFKIAKAVNSQMELSEITGAMSGEPEIDNAAGFLSVDGNLVTVVADVITPI